MSIKKDDSCNSVTTTLGVLGGKWKPAILYLLQSKVWRFNELNRAVTGITQKMLTQQLRELEGDGLIARKVYAEVPPRVEYTLTTYGRTLKPVLTAMNSWGDKHKKRAS